MWRLELAAVQNRLEMKNRRHVHVLAENVEARTCGLCGGFYRARADAPATPLCPACRTEAVAVASIADPRVTG